MDLVGQRCEDPQFEDRADGQWLVAVVFVVGVAVAVGDVVDPEGRLGSERGDVGVELCECVSLGQVCVCRLEEQALDLVGFGGGERQGDRESGSVG
ncbi:MAG: hypothetical protein WBM50_13515 [Acidimicrobiales bacterium]